MPSEPNTPQEREVMVSGIAAATVASLGLIELADHAPPFRQRATQLSIPAGHRPVDVQIPRRQVDLVLGSRRPNCRRKPNRHHQPGSERPSKSFNLFHHSPSLPPEHARRRNQMAQLTYTSRQHPAIRLSHI